MTGSRSLPLLRVFGIRVGVNYSWFLVLFLVIYIVWDSLRDTLDASNTTLYVVAVVSAFAFFASILLHELGHALAARREGIGVEGIDLFLFGGVMKMSRETDSPGAEFRVAAAGPLVTLLIMGLAAGAAVLVAGADGFWDAARLSGSGRRHARRGRALAARLDEPGPARLQPRARLPARRRPDRPRARLEAHRRPPQGHAHRRLHRRRLRLAADRLAASPSRSSRDAVIDGIWFAALGWLLASSARGALAQTAFTEQLEGITVADIMDAEPVTIPAALPAARAYEEFFLRYHGWEWFAVVEDDGRYAGIAHRAAVEHAALREGAGDAPVREVAAGGDQVPADAPLEALLGSEPLRRLGALMAVDGDGRLRGVVTKRAGHARHAGAARADRVDAPGRPTVRDLTRAPARSTSVRGISSNWSLDSTTRIPASAARRRTSSST